MPMPLVLVSLASWGWRHWALLLGAALLVGSYLGLVSWAVVERAIERLAVYSPAGFGETTSQKQEGLFIVFAFLLLTAPAVMAGLLILGFVVLVASGVIEPLTRSLDVPDWVPRLATVGALGWAAWMYQAAWFPAARRTVGLVAAAYLALTR